MAEAKARIKINKLLEEAINRIELATNQGFKIIVIKNFERAIPEFVALMMTMLKEEMEKLASGGTFKEISKTNFCNLQIPLPPLSIQQQIVSKIESYQKIIDGAKQVTENYKPQIDIDASWEMVRLENVFKLSSGKGLTQQNIIEGKFPVYGGNGINGYHKEYFIEKPIIVIGRVGAYCGSIHVTEPKSWVTDNGLYVTEYLKEINQDYLAQILVQLELNQFAKVGGQPSISQTTVYEREIPLPPISVQQEIVKRIEEEQTLVNSNKKLIEIFEQKIKDEINKLWLSPAIASAKAGSKPKTYAVPNEKLSIAAEE